MINLQLMHLWLSKSCVWLFTFRYTGPVSDLDVLRQVVQEGPTSVIFTQLVEWLVQNIADLTGVVERVQAISGWF